MYCLKCGAETPNQQLFCPGCLDGMKEYPVRADAPVNLPKRQPTMVKKSKQKEIPPEQQIAKLRTRVRRLTLSTFLLILALAVTLTFLFFRVFQKEASQTLTGRNYTVTEQK